MTEFAKFIDIDTIKRPPRHLRTPQIIAFNFDKNETLLRQEGYLPLVEDEQQEVAEGYYLRPQYQLVEQSHTETVDKVIIDEEGNETTEQETVTVDDSYIAVHWIEEELVEEEE